MNEPTKLKPCPFCGNEADLKQISKNGLEIKCRNCKSKIVQKCLKFDMKWLESKIAETWNKRFFHDGGFSVEEYATAARVVQLYLDDFCDKGLIATDQIAEAARRAKTYIDKMQMEIKHLRKLI